METASITDIAWPGVTRTMLADFERNAATYDPSEVNQEILHLIRARKAIGDAIIKCGAAARHVPDSHGEVIERLAELSQGLRDIHDRFPLTVLENGGGHPRPKIFQGQ